MKKCIGCIWLVRINEKVSLCPFASCFVKKRPGGDNFGKVNGKTEKIRR